MSHSNNDEHNGSPLPTVSSPASPTSSPSRLPPPIPLSATSLRSLSTGKQRYCLRLHAANLPFVKRRGAIFRKSPPDCYAVVTSLRHGPMYANLISATVGLQNSERDINQDNDNTSPTTKETVPSHVWGMTEIIRQSANPHWTRGINFDFELDSTLYFYVHIFAAPELDENGFWTTDINLNTLDFATALGSAVFEAGDILRTCRFTRVKRLRQGGCVFCRIEKVQASRRSLLASPELSPEKEAVEQVEEEEEPDMLRLTVAARNLILPHGKRRLNRQPSQAELKDIVLEVSKLTIESSAPVWSKVHRCHRVDKDCKIWHDRNERDDQLYREEGKNGKALVFDLTIDTSSLCNSNFNLPLRFSLLMDEGKETIGLCETTFHHVLLMAKAHEAIKQKGGYLDNDDDDDVEDFLYSEGESEDFNKSNVDKFETRSYSVVIGVNPVVANPKPAASPIKHRRSDELVLQRSMEKAKRVGSLRVCRLLYDGPDLLDEPGTYNTPERYDGPQSEGYNQPEPYNKPEEYDNPNAYNIYDTPEKPSSFPDPSMPVVEVVDLAKIGSQSRLGDEHLSNDARPENEFKTFMDRKCELKFSVAIDFTSSNGDPLVPGTLHYQSETGLNDYEETILALGKAIDAYSQSKEYNLWGFGAKFGGVVRHLFQCGSTIGVHGTDGLLSAYKTVFQSDLIMSGPTILLQVLQAAAVQAKCDHVAMTADTMSYHVLLIITDGLADEFEETQRKLSVYSEMPLSIVIVGVGALSDFSRMYHLVSPIYDAASHTAVRPNVSFVEFRKHQYDPAALGEAALAQVPAQLCDYMKRRGF